MTARSSAADLQAFLDDVVYPQLFNRLPEAFPEFGWVERGSAWVATTWPSGFPCSVGHEVPERLTVYPDRPYWMKVHGHAGVRFLDYVNNGRRPTGEEFLVAVRHLAERAGADTTILKRQLSADDIKRVRIRELRRAVLHLVYAQCQDALWSEAGLAARAYLHGERYLTDEEIRSLQLGLYPPTLNLLRALAAAGVDPIEARDAGVARDKLEGFLVLPWFDSQGHPLTIYGRWPGKALPRKVDLPAWRSERDQEFAAWEKRSPEERSEEPWSEPSVPKTLALFGAGTKASPLFLDRARAAQHEEVAVVEGIFDAAVLQVRGDSRVVASVAAQLSGEQVDTLVRCRIKSVFICGDPDGGGDRGTLANIEALTKAGIATYVVPRLPDSLDPDEYVARDGIDAWRERVRAATAGNVFRAELILSGITPDSPDAERDRAVKRIVELVDGLAGAWGSIDASEILKRTASRVGYPVAAIRRLGAPKQGPGTAQRSGTTSCPASPGQNHGLLDFIRRENGTPEPNVANAMVVLSSDPRWKDVLAFDEFAQEVVTRRPPPYAGTPAPVPEAPVPWRDEDDIETAAWIQAHHRLNVRVETVADAVLAVARKAQFHPVRNYLNGLTWDGKKRIDTWLPVYLGAEDNEYTRAVGSRWLISAVARVVKPGCKADQVLILEEGQGVKKSTSLRTLGAPWFTDELDAIGSKDTAVQLQGVWIVELAELDALGRAEISRTKAFISKSFDRFRPPYGRHAIRFDRQCVFAGTVNHSDYLKDETGNRRFWPVKCGPVTEAGELDVASLARDRDQLWAEAVAAFRAGHPWWIEGRSLAVLAQAEQDRRFHVDVWEPLIEEHVAQMDFVTLGGVLTHLGIDVPKQGQVEQNRASRCLRHLGWSRVQRREGERRVWGYRPPTNAPSPVRAVAPVSTESGAVASLSASTPSPLSPLSSVGKDPIGGKSRVVGDRKYFVPYRDVGNRCDTGESRDSGDAGVEAPPTASLSAPCLACRGTDYWTSTSGVVVCRRCHPPADKEVYR